MTITDIGIELCRYSVVFSLSALVSRQMQSRIRIDSVHLANVPQSLSHICVPNSEIDLVKKSST